MSEVEYPELAPLGWPSAYDIESATDFRNPNKEPAAFKILPNGELFVFD